MSTLHAPTIIYPNGGESLASPTIDITWRASAIPDSAGRDVWYELFYCDDYYYGQEPNWVAIASVPSTVEAFSWRASRNIRSNKVRIAIRSRNSIGERSPMSVCAADYSLNRRSLPVPRVLSPVTGGSYDSIAKIVVTADRVPDRSFYQFYYSSPSNGIPVTALGSSTPVTGLPYTWVTAELPSGTDYSLYAAVVDADGSTSQLTEVKGITIAHQGVFLIDTLPPRATVKINNDQTFTNSRDITVSVYAVDEATGVQSMQLNSGTDSAVTASPEKGKDATSHQLVGDDGVKQIKALVQDFGGNRTTDLSVSRTIIDAMHLDDAEVEDFTVSTDSGLSFVHAVTTGDSQGLYSFLSTTYPRRKRVLTDTPTAIGVYLGEEYVGVTDDDGVGFVLVNTTTEWAEVEEFEAGLYVTAMATFDGVLYIGMSDGSLRSFNGATFDVVSEWGENGWPVDEDSVSEVGTPPVKNLWVIDYVLVITFENSRSLYTYDGTTVREVRT